MASSTITPASDAGDGTQTPAATQPSTDSAAPAEAQAPSPSTNGATHHGTVAPNFADLSARTNSTPTGSGVAGHGGSASSANGASPTTPVPEVPFFEGKPVEATRLKVTTVAAGLEIDTVLRMDDIIRVVIEARVSQVDHKVNERTGALVRHQAAKVITAALIAWNDDDPNDQGVLRG